MSRKKVSNHVYVKNKQIIQVFVLSIIYAQ